MFGIKKKIDEALSEYFTNYDKENSRIGIKLFLILQDFFPVKLILTTSTLTQKKSTENLKLMIFQSS